MELENFKLKWFPKFSNKLPRTEERENLFNDMIQSYQEFNSKFLDQSVIFGHETPEILKFIENELLKWEGEEYVNLRSYIPYTVETIKDELNTSLFIDGGRISNPVDHDCTGVYIRPQENPKYRQLSKLLNTHAIKKWNMGNRVGDASAFGKIYVGCSMGDKNCNYIIKIINVNKGASINSMEDILSEVEIQIQASKYNLAPKIHDIFYCKSSLKDYFAGQTISSSISQTYDSSTKIKYNSSIYQLGDKIPMICEKDRCQVINRTVYIIMDKMDITVFTFLDVLPYYREILLDLMKSIISRLHRIGIIHGDVHSSNFMFNFTPLGRDKFLQYTLNNDESIIDQDKNRDFYGSFKSLMIIDFGKSKDINSIDNDKLQKLFARDFVFLEHI